MVDGCPEFEEFYGSFRAVLEYGAEHRHDKDAIVHVEAGGERAQRLSFGELHQQATRYASGLHACGLRRGDRLAMMLAPGLEFFVALCGALLLGVVPVLIYPPLSWRKLEHYLGIQTAILVDSGARMLLVHPRARWLVGTIIERAPALERVLTPGDVDRSAGPIELPTPALDDLALLQYTAGTTAVPKGVRLTYRNVFTTMRCLGEAGGTTWEGEVLCSWLPLYHGMGLLSSIFFCSLWGFTFVGTSPVEFLRQPASWLHMISQNKGTISVAPAFSIEFCNRRLRDEDLAGLDLSSLRWLLIGAGHLPRRSAETFLERLAPCGFERETAYPVYGLAESTVGAFSPVGRPGPRYLRVDWTRLQPGDRVRVVPDDEEGSDLVAFGKVLACDEARILDEGAQPLPELIVGEIALGGPTIAAGYHNDQDAFASRLVRVEGVEPPLFRTGDLGFFHEGELFVVGRSEDRIPLAGRATLYPEHVEEIVEACAGIRKGCCAAVGLPGDQGEPTLAVVAECKVTSPDDRAAVVERVERAVEQVVGVAPSRVALIPAHTIPKTSSGKLQRHRCRELLVSGELPTTSHVSLWTKAQHLVRSQVGSRRFKKRTASALSA